MMWWLTRNWSLLPSINTVYVAGQCNECVKNVIILRVDIQLQKRCWAVNETSCWNEISFKGVGTGEGGVCQKCKEKLIFLAWNLKKWKYQINLVTICFENKAFCFAWQFCNPASPHLPQSGLLLYTPLILWLEIQFYNNGSWNGVIYLVFSYWNSNLSPGVNR